MKIINLCSENYLRGVDKVIIKLLERVSPSHLNGLQSIILMNDLKYKGAKGAAGMYLPSSKNELAHIELAVDKIYLNMPRLFFCLPFFRKILLARVLYHEIGHHFQKLQKTNLKKRNWEYFATEYCNHLLKQEFRGWLIALRPFIYLWILIRRIRPKENVV